MNKVSEEEIHRRHPGYVVFLWIYSAIWVAALCWTWIKYDQLALWAKVVVDFLLFATTPIVADLFISRRRLRGQR